MDNIDQIEEALRGVIVRGEPMPGSRHSPPRADRFPYPYPVFLSPVLSILADQGVHAVEEIRERIADELEIAPEHLAIRIESIHQFAFVNRVALALSQLVYHKAITAGPDGKGSYRITPHGLAVFQAHRNGVRVQDTYQSN